MSNGYATGIPVSDPPDWLKAAAPGIGFRLLMVGVCDICETQKQGIWQTEHHGYTYCRACLEEQSLFLAAEQMS